MGYIPRWFQAVFVVVVGSRCGEKVVVMLRNNDIVRVQQWGTNRVVLAGR